MHNFQLVQMSEARRNLGKRAFWLEIGDDINVCCGVRPRNDILQ